MTSPALDQPDPMAGDDVDIATREHCWVALLALAENLRLARETTRYCSLRIGADSAVVVNGWVKPGAGYLIQLLVNAGTDPVPGTPGPALSPPPLHDKRWACLRWDGGIRIHVEQAGDVPAEIIEMVQLYAPYCCAPLVARARRMTVAVSHFAQSLDGCVATADGDSKWIGCPENHTHAHRMRALCDAVLVGAHTVDRDRPRLNVRHVSGPDPVRIIVGTPKTQCENLLACGNAPVWVLGGQPQEPGSALHVIPVERTGRWLDCNAVLRTLFERGLQSVYIEGGATTTSRFLLDGAIDILQLHISPLLIGAGLRAFDLPSSTNIAEALRFETSVFHRVANEIMFVGQRPCLARTNA